jgi:phospho-acceptor domain-containing protein
MMHGNSTPAPFVEDEASRPAPARTQRPSKRRRARIQRQLIDGFSHDVRTPITVINEYLSLLADDFDAPDADERSKMVDVICDRVDDLNRTFSNFVDALRLDVRALRTSPCPGAVADVIAPLRRALERKAALRDRTVVFDLPADIPEVFCDKEQIGRVIFNLAAHIINNFPQSSSRAVRIWAAASVEHQEVIVGVSDQEKSQSAARGANGSLIGSGKSLRQKIRTARDVLRHNLAELEWSTTRETTSFWFGLPLAEPLEIASRYLKQRQRPRRGCTVAFAKLWCAQSLGGSLGRDVQSFLGILLRAGDLLLPVGREGWLLLLCRKETALPEFAPRMHALREKVNQKRPREPLPPLHLDPLGTWSPTDPMGPILETVQTSFDLKPAFTP